VFPYHKYSPVEEKDSDSHSDKVEEVIPELMEVCRDVGDMLDR
jgi:hypothetical protein